MSESHELIRDESPRSLADRVRDISLGELLRWHRFEIKPEGITFRARSDRYNIVVTRNRWFDNRPESEG